MASVPRPRQGLWSAPLANGQSRHSQGAASCLMEPGVPGKPDWIRVWTVIARLRCTQTPTLRTMRVHVSPYLGLEACIQPSRGHDAHALLLETKGKMNRPGFDGDSDH